MISTALWTLSGVIWGLFVLCVLLLVRLRLREWLRQRRLRRHYAEVFESAGLRLVKMTAIGTDHTHFEVAIIDAPQFAGTVQERMIHAAIIAQMRPMP